jgi:two-component sensor histidine kinase
MLVVFEDITEREKSEAAKDMILAETKHRMKNLIGTVRAMIRQTPLESHTIEEYRDIVLGRLEAILIAQETISGGPETALAALVQKSLHAIGLDRIVFAESPKINISQHQVQPLSLIFHELATNAVKYGTLSRAEGHIHLGWRKEQQGDGQLLVLDWREDGGPAVTEPKRHGFGTDLIDFSLKGEGGEIIRHFEPSGLRLQLRLPLHRE